MLAEQVSTSRNSVWRVYDRLIAVGLLQVRKGITESTGALSRLKSSALSTPGRHLVPYSEQDCYRIPALPFICQPLIAFPRQTKEIGWVGCAEARLALGELT